MNSLISFFFYYEEEKEELIWWCVCSQDFLLQIFTVFRILIRPEMFPKDWTVMRLVTNK